MLTSVFIYLNTLNFKSLAHIRKHCNRNRAFSRYVQYILHCGLKKFTANIIKLKTRCNRNVNFVSKKWWYTPTGILLTVLILKFSNSIGLFGCLGHVPLKAVCISCSRERTQQLANSKYSDICKMNQQEGRRNMSYPNFVHPNSSNLNIITYYYLHSKMAFQSELCRILVSFSIPGKRLVLQSGKSETYHIHITLFES